MPINIRPRCGGAATKSRRAEGMIVAKSWRADGACKIAAWLH